MNVVIYARFSSHNQTEQSIEGQLKECYAYAEKNGYNVIGEYIDRAISGTTDSRPEFLKMIEDSAKRCFEGILVYQLDRFARNRYDSAIYKAKLKKNNVRVLSARENISDDASGIIVEGLFESIAEYYSAELSQKIKRGMSLNAEKCLYTGGGKALGFKTVDKHFVIDEENAPVVVRIFEMYAAGKTVVEICDTLNAEQRKTSSGGSFNKNSLRKILQNKKYIGTYTYNGVETPDVIPRIVSDELFEQVQQKLGINKAAPAHSKAKQEYILTTKLFCGKCHEMMTGITGNSHTGRKYFYYKCNNAKKKLCDKATVQKEYIEDIVIQECRAKLTTENIEKISRLAYAICENDSNDLRIKDIDKKLKENEKQKDNLLSSLRICEIDSVKQTIFEELQKIDQEKAALEKELAAERIATTAYSHDDIKHFLESLAKGDVNDLKYRKMLVNVLLNKLYLYDDKLVFYFNTSDKPVEISLELIKQVEADDGFVFKPSCSTNKAYLSEKGRYALFLCAESCYNADSNFFAGRTPNLNLGRSLQMSDNDFTENKKNKIKKIKRANYIVFGIFGVIVISLFIWFCSYQYWQSFSPKKWAEHPDKRAKMTADLLEDYELVGMSEDEVIALLGQNNNDYGYFNQDNRFVYYLGNERTIIDSEWLLIEFENGVVNEYSMTTD